MKLPDQPAKEVRYGCGRIAQKYSSHHGDRRIFQVEPQPVVRIEDMTVLRSLVLGASWLNGY